MGKSAPDTNAKIPTVTLSAIHRHI